MAKRRKPDSTPAAGGEVEDRLARLLESPGLARVVPHLPPEALHRLIRHRGLEASAELVTAATPAQLTSLLDLDLWRGSQAGGDEQFDVDRFGEWIEVLAGVGESAAARLIARLDSDLVIAGLTRYVRVFDPGIFEPTAQSDDEAVDRHEAMREGDAIHLSSEPAAGLECELGGYLVRARRADAWDPIVALLATLEVEDVGCFHTLMQGCRELSNSRPEVDGLDDLLLAPEQHLHDVAVEREGRRSEQGYATPSDARVFLEMARQPQRTRAVNPIVTAYFRAATDPSTAPSPPGDAHAGDVPESIDAVLTLLGEAGLMPGQPRALLAAPEEPDAGLGHLRRLMAYVRDADLVAYLERSRELAFLANVLVAGCSVQSRAFTPQEASEAAAATCNLGLEHWLESAPGARLADTFLVDHDLIAAFEAGWSLLHHDVGLAAASRLVTMLQTVHTVDEDVQQGLVALRRALAHAHASGTPWTARDATEILAMLDMTAWVAVLGLLDECPILPAALTAIVDGSALTVSQTEFAFISTDAQIDAFRAFMRKLPDILEG